MLETQIIGEAVALIKIVYHEIGISAVTINFHVHFTQKTNDTLSAVTLVLQDLLIKTLKTKIMINYLIRYSITSVKNERMRQVI